MKKKIVSLCLVVALAATAVIGGTLAYFTDSEQATNVMTIGSVKIKQIEQERNEKGELVPFTQAKPAFPAVGKIEWAEKTVTVGGTEHKVFNEGLKNVVDKFITVENVGKSDAYVRTIVAIEAPGYDAKNLIHVNVNNTNGVKMTSWAGVEIGGVEYVYAVFTYDEALAPGAISAPSLAQIFLDAKTTNEDVAALGDTWEVLALSQAVQKEGFDDPATALNEAFGDATAQNVASWFKAPVIVEASPESGAVRPAGYNPVDENTNVVKGVTVLDNSDENTNLRALYTGDGKTVDGDLDVIDCYFDGTYAMNVIGDDTGVLTVDGTDLRGWVSYDGFTSASFTNCTFGENSNPELYNTVRPYSDVTFTNCAFNGTTFWLDKLPEGAKVTFVDCTLNGVDITAASQLTIEQGVAGAVVIG